MSFLTFYIVEVVGGIFLSIPYYYSVVVHYNYNIVVVDEIYHVQRHYAAHIHYFDAVYYAEDFSLLMNDGHHLAGVFY